MLAGFLDPPIWRPENSVDMWNFGYPGDWLSELNQQTIAQVLFLTLIFFRQTRSRRSFVSRIAITPKFKMRRFSNQVRPPTGLKWCKCRSLYAWWMFPPAWLISFDDVTWKRLIYSFTGGIYLSTFFLSRPQPNNGAKSAYQPEV